MNKKIILIIIIYFLLLLLNYPFTMRFYNYNRNNTINNSEQNIKTNETLFEVVTNSHNYVFNAHFGFLTQSIPNKIKRNPDISVVIPIFNSENYIRRTILSIQNQNFSDFEIIIINDNSIDNSLKIVNKLSEIDKRIKVINNKKNMGQFYGRCIGTILSKGKYIFPLDSDDMYLIHDTFYSVYNELKKNKPDFLLFKGIRSFDFNNFFKNENISFFRGNINNNKIFYQPSIVKSSYKQCSLQASSISKNLYLKIINTYGKFHLYDHIAFCEDCIINHFMYQFAKSCEHFTKVGYLYIYRASSHSHTDAIINKRKSEIYYIEVLYEYSQFSNRTKMLSLRLLKDFINDKNFKFVLKEEKTKMLVKSLINKIIRDKSISTINKKNFNISIFSF